MISVKVALSPKVSYGIRLFSSMNRVLVRAFENFQGALSICFYKEAHSGGPYISDFSHQQVTSIKIAVASKEG